MISLICAMDRQGLIGLNGDLPWHRPADLKNFAQLTKGHTVVMGRKTYESIGKPLEGRNNIVLSKKGFQYEFDGENPNMFCKINNVLFDYKGSSQECFVIGGASIYEQFAPYIERMYITVVDQITPLNGGNATYFPWPAFSNTKWNCIEQKMLGPDFYYVYERINHGITKEKDC